MTPTESLVNNAAPANGIQHELHELTLRVGQLEAETHALELENKTLRLLLDRVIEHRQKSHGELVLLLTGLVTKLPINDIGVTVSKLVEHNKHVGEVCAALSKAKAGAEMTLPQPSILRALDQTKQDLAAALKPAVEELIRLDAPFESEMLQSLVAKPESFFSPNVVRAVRCFIKCQLPRERVIREFGEGALGFFNDMTTDPKRNPRPKQEEIVLCFKDDFEALLQQNSALSPDRKQALQALRQKIQRCKTSPDQARAQKIAFARLSFILELLHYYENQGTEAPDVIFAQRLPALIEQLMSHGTDESPDEKLIVQAEALMAFVVSPDHRLMLINNVGKTGGAAKTVKFVLRLRLDKDAAQNPVIQTEVVPEFIRHLIPVPPQKPPSPQTLAATLRLFDPALQKLVTRFIYSWDRLPKQDAEALGRAVAKELDLIGIEETKVPATSSTASSDIERELAWEKIKDLIARRAEPAAIAAAVRGRLHEKYDADELKQSWVTLIETDTISLIRTFCQLPYLPDGTTDSLAAVVMQTYVSRLMHEKYAATYNKVVNSLRNMFKTKPDSPTLVNFLTLVKWVDAEAAKKLGVDIGMPGAAH